MHQRQQKTSREMKLGMNWQNGLVYVRDDPVLTLSSPALLAGRNAGVWSGHLGEPDGAIKEFSARTYVEPDPSEDDAPEEVERPLPTPEQTWATRSRPM